MSGLADIATDHGLDRALEALRDAARTSRQRKPVRISVGIINNMPDSALQSAERQFVNYLESAADHFDIRVQMFSLPTIARDGAARDHVAASYLDFGRLEKMHMDALLVTGAVPIERSLPNEPFWPQLAALADWARTHTLSTLWSCLSAHAAVLHLDGIERRRLPAKLSGLFDIDMRSNHWLFAGIGGRMCVPHSRYNALDETKLRAADYDILSRSDAVGADIFTKATPSEFIFFQGHPEYDQDTLMREFRRDVGRYLDGSSADYPTIPSRYFTADAERALQQFAVLAHANRNPDTMSCFPDLDGSVQRSEEWQTVSARLFRNWIGRVVTRKLSRLAGVAA